MSGCGGAAPQCPAASSPGREVSERLFWGLRTPLLGAQKHRLAAEYVQFAVLFSTKCEVPCQLAVKANIDILVRREEKLVNSTWDKTLFKRTEPLLSQAMCNPAKTKCQTVAFKEQDK